MKNKNSIKSIKNHKGFSLLEMLISIFIFVLIITTAVSIFAGMTSTRQKSRKIQSNMESARTALDLMAKNMRMSTGLQTRNGAASDTEIYMYNTSQGQCIDYRFSGTELILGQATPPSGITDCRPGVNVTYNATNSFPITPTNVSGRFIINPTNITNRDIGKATVILTITDGAKITNVQTSVSFRDYNGIIQ